jgi:hypothetical protein
VLLVLALVGALGAALGLLATIGYALGDFLFNAHEDLFFAATSPFSLQRVRFDLALLDTYLILFGLLAIIPLVAIAVRKQMERLVRSGTAGQLFGFGAAAVVQAVLAYFWAQSAAFLIRPVWSFLSTTPDIGSISPLQHGAVWIALVTALGVTGRATLTILAARRPASPGRRYVRFSMHRPLPWPVPVLLQAALFTLLLAGIIESFLEAVLLFAVFAGLGVLRYRVVPRLRPYVTVVNRIPLLVRIAACALLGYLMSALVVQPALVTGTSSFTPMVVAILPPLVLAAVLLPKVSPERSGR